MSGFGNSCHRFKHGYECCSNSVQLKRKTMLPTSLAKQQCPIQLFRAVQKKRLHAAPIIFPLVQKKEEEEQKRTQKPETAPPPQPNARRTAATFLPARTAPPPARSTPRRRFRTRRGRGPPGRCGRPGPPDRAPTDPKQRDLCPLSGVARPG